MERCAEELKTIALMVVLVGGWAGIFLWFRHDQRLIQKQKGVQNDKS